MGTLNATTSKQEIRTTPSNGDLFTNPLVDKVLAVMACIPVVYPVIRHYHSLEFDVSTVTWVLDVVVILSTMLFRRTAVRVTRNPWLWLLTCVATYWFLMIGFVEQNGRPLAPLLVTNSLAILSTIVELWGRFSLGRNIGFVPAQREVVTRGAYKYVRHPIYTGLFIWIVGYWLSGYSPRNTLLYALAIFWFSIKSVVEERFLRADPGYAAYMERVRWRWIPIPFLARVNSRTAQTNAALLISLSVLASASALAQQTTPDEETAKQVAAKTIRAEAVRAHMRFLSDSLLKGRDPGSPEYEIAAHYVAAQLEAMGVQPAGVQDTWFQKVPFIKATPDDAKSSIVFSNGKQEIGLKDLEDFMFYADVAHTDSSVEAPVVFVGYGITALELKYDDYTGTDVKGKIVASISNAPPTFSASQAAYYANETRKARNAAAHGAIGRLDRSRFCCLASCASTHHRFFVHDRRGR